MIDCEKKKELRADPGGILTLKNGLRSQQRRLNSQKRQAKGGVTREAVPQ